LPYIPIAEARGFTVTRGKQLITRMGDMKKTLERLDYKIATYEQVVVEKEKELNS